IGMLLDFNFMLQHLFVILLLAVVALLLKGLVATLAARILKYPLRTSLLVGLSIFQVGEFAFILSKVGIANGLLTTETYQYFLSVSLPTMGATPFVIQYYHSIASAISSKFGTRQDSQTNRQQPDNSDPIHDLDDHVVIIGY